MAKFDIRVEKAADVATVYVSGILDEDVDFNLYSLNQLKKIDLKLADVKGINSCGIREWIRWLGQAKDAQITFHQCPKVIVDQMNMVDGFLPSGASVASFYVPYYSDESGTEKMVLFSVGKEFSDGSVHPPKDVKDNDGHLMEMDIIEAKYFKFLKK